MRISELLDFFFFFVKGDCVDSVNRFKKWTGEMGNRYQTAVTGYGKE